MDVFSLGSVEIAPGISGLRHLRHGTALVDPDPAIVEGFHVEPWQNGGFQISDLIGEIHFQHGETFIGDNGT